MHHSFATICHLYYNYDIHKLNILIYNPKGNCTYYDKSNALLGVLKSSRNLMAFIFVSESVIDTKKYTFQTIFIAPDAV